MHNVTTPSTALLWSFLFPGWYHILSLKLSYQNNSSVTTNFKRKASLCLGTCSFHLHYRTKILATNYPTAPPRFPLCCDHLWMFVFRPLPVSSIKCTQGGTKACFWKKSFRKWTKISALDRKSREFVTEAYISMLCAAFSSTKRDSN